jgi:putative membrane protein
MNDQIDKKLILRESLALQRTTLANQTTILAFLRTAMYFAVAGLSTRNVLQIENIFLIELAFYAISFLILISGIVNFVKHRKKIQENKKHIGDYKLAYYE